MNYFDHIEDYIHNRLSDKEREVFDNAIQNDAKLQEAVADAKLVALIGEAAFEEEVRGMIEDELQVEGGGSHEKSSVKFNPKIVAAICIVIAILVWAFSEYLKSEKEEIQKSNIQFADLYVEPAWPQTRGGEIEMVNSYVTNYIKSSNTLFIDSLKNNLDTLNAAYWLSEIYLSEAKPDSVLKYLPKSSDIKTRRDRINYLEITSLYLKEDYRKIKNLVNDLPLDTDKWYLEKYKEMIK